MLGKFSQNIQADADGYYMSIPEVAAIYIAGQLREFSSAIELCCAVGIQTFQLAQIMPTAYGIDIDRRRIQYAIANAKLYGAENARFICGDALDESLLQKFNVDVALLDPDWSSAGGDKQTHTVDLDRMQPSLSKMMQLTQTYLSQNIVARVPKEFDLQTLEEFGPYPLESIFIDGSLKFKVAYFLPGRPMAETDVYLESLGS